MAKQEQARQVQHALKSNQRRTNNVTNTAIDKQNAWG
jgi:hypothetical protein